MSEKEPGKSTRGARPAPTAASEDYPVTSSNAGYPSGDYSYTVDLVGSLNHQLGKLTEAVETLKEHAREQGKKLDEIRMDVHGAKAAGKTLLWVVGVVGTLLGIFLAAYLHQMFGGNAR